MIVLERIVMRIIWLSISIILGAVGQVFFKLGMSKSRVENLSPAFVGEIVRNPWVWAGGISYGLSFVLWLYVLKFFPLSVARPLTSLGYILTYFLSVIFIAESFTALRLAGIVLITAGVILVAL
jgi:multidrug transporter EmrE-like cation transporter